MIELDIEVGDTILTGKFKNKKVVVKDIGMDEYGAITVNGRSIMNIRIPKLYKKNESIIKLANLLTEVIRKVGNKWLVYSKKGKVLGTHTTKEKALAQLRAIEVNK